jgi:hypothetical protein
VNFTTFDVVQRSPEWAALRAGLVTGSCAPAILAVRKKGTGELKVRADLRHQLVCERLTGRPSPRAFRESAAMTHGTDTEPDAVAAYEAATGLPVLRVGFVRHNVLQAGCSPDGYVGNWQGVIEAKCPDSTTHLGYLQADVIPDEYFGQLLHTMWLTGAEWGDFVSFDPRFDGPLQLFVKRLRREDCDMPAYELALSLFLSEVENDVAVMLHRAACLAVA